jgi:ribosomal protein L37AE/L43A
MAAVRRIAEEDRAFAQRDERAHPCDRCHAALGTRVFDTSWVCAGCAEAMAAQLRQEANRVSPMFRRTTKQ